MNWFVTGFCSVGESSAQWFVGVVGWIMMETDSVVGQPRGLDSEEEMPWKKSCHGGKDMVFSMAGYDGNG